MSDSSRNIKLVISSILLFAFVLVIPVLLHTERFSRLVGNFHGENLEIIELFGFSASFGLLGAALIEARLTRPKTWQDWLPLALGAFIGFVWLSILTETSGFSGDYPCYENAARALQTRHNPYHGCYFYPPLLAQTLAGLEHIISGLGGLLIGRGFPDEAAWPLVFYLFQTVQFVLIIIAFRLSLTLAKDLQLDNSLGLVAVTGLFILDNPLLRTLVVYQVNLWILVAILVALILARRRPFWAGISAAFGGHIKLYPWILALPFAAQKNWKALVGMVVGLLAFLFVPISLGFRWITWEQFSRFFLVFPQYNAMRNNSFYSLVANILLLSGIDVSNESSPWHVAPQLGYYLMVILMVVWLVIRFLQRQKIARLQAIPIEAGNLLADHGLFMDMIAAQLLVSPSLWEHHFVIVLPVALWVLSFQLNISGRPQLLAAIAALIMIYALPTFEIFPFSYLRLLGLILLLYLTSPSRASVH